MPVRAVPAGGLWFLRRGHGPPLVLLHGAGGAARHWGYQLAGLQTATTLAPDLPGHGRSPGPSLATLPALAARLVAWLDTLELGPVVLIGHSMGGAIALQIALTAPDRLRGLVLVSSGACFPAARAILDRLPPDGPPPARLLARLLYSRAGPQRLEAERELAAVPLAVLRADYAACAAWRRPDLPAGFAVPTLIVVGREDRLTPLHLSAELQSRLVGSELVVIPDAGHMVMIEQPAAVNRAITSWLATLNGSAGRYNPPGG